jgi:hypothetical protein
MTAPAKRRTGGPGINATVPDGHLPEYQVWIKMRERCFSPRCKEYKHYGGRGITVCRRWQGPQGFARFIQDLGPRPFPGASIHRLDNDGNYTPKNVVWANRATQNRNMRSNRILRYAGKSQILTDWANEVGMKPGTLGARLAKGWSVVDALTRPVEPRRPYAEWTPQTRSRRGSLP